MIRPHKNSESEPQIPPHTELLVTDMETYVNENVHEYLDGYPSILKATDYQVLRAPDGKLPAGIRRIDNAYVTKVAPGERELSGVDILMQFPLQYEAENPINVTFTWNDGTHCRIAIVDKRPVLIVENGDSTLYSGFIDMDELASYLNSCGLPKSIWGADINQAIEDIDSSSDTHIYQRASIIIDPYTTMEIVHEKRFKTDIHETRKILDELCLNIDHLEYNASILTDDIYLPPAPTYRNMLRFERNETEDGTQQDTSTSDEESWSYRGAYSGKLELGEFVDALVQIDPKLVIPNSKIVAKALSVMKQKPY
ncbi:MAG: hypothetical protein JWO54_769 [Candidatus Saccharibacteria bacterium]|nr:hypothetical protein [Candidatus Saccharibacteria bacterium]